MRRKLPPDTAALLRQQYPKREEVAAARRRFLAKIPTSGPFLAGEEDATIALNDADEQIPVDFPSRRGKDSKIGRA